MVMFSSKTVRDLITYDGDVCLRCWGLVPREGVHYVPDDGALCECDILSDVVQHNPPNLILTSIREGHHDIDSALGLLQDDAREWWTPVVTDPMIDHARKVLTRLTRGA